MSDQEGLSSIPDSPAPASISAKKTSKAPPKTTTSKTGSKANPKTASNTAISKSTAAKKTTSASKGISKPVASVAKKGKGSSSFPISRVQKIIKADPEVTNCSKEASFLISQATEFFVKKFVDQGYLKSRTDGRKTIQLKDLTSVVRATPDFMFLEELIPDPVTLNQALAMRAKKLATDDLPVGMSESDEPEGSDEESIDGEEQTATTSAGRQTFFAPTGSAVAKGKGRGTGVTRARKSLKKGESSANGTSSTAKKTSEGVADGEATEDAPAAEDGATSTDVPLVEQSSHMDVDTSS
ncbi:DNA polymerase epsilon, subunit C [Phaffia rhodozyma]|uniref:DNA polymerase epsilon, subunit C n=1 Tax=Phaffia rhodozyma TaxID=264483 RepID=A0A0F7SL56_PHARH|nr:DNA polymerase epsilon, subunit C [Phaffia rhodozyma]